MSQTLLEDFDENEEFFPEEEEEDLGPEVLEEEMDELSKEFVKKIVERCIQFMDLFRDVTNVSHSLIATFIDIGFRVQFIDFRSVCGQILDGVLHSS